MRQCRHTDTRAGCCRQQLDLHIMVPANSTLCMGLSLCWHAHVCTQELLQQVRTPGSSACGSSSAISSDDQGPPTAELPPRRTQRLWAAVTPEAVLSMQGISTAELAGQCCGGAC